MKRWIEFSGLTVFFIACFGATFLAGYYARALSAQDPRLRWALPGLSAAEGRFAVLEEAWALIEANYHGALPDSEVLEHGAIRGYVGAIGDPYTVFIEPQAAELESQSLQGEYGGIGVDIRRTDAGEIVLKPFPDSPAESAGILEGDVLVSVDGARLTPETTIEEVTAMVRGLVGTRVAIVVRHLSGQQTALSIERRAIALPSVTWRLAEDQPSVGIIALSRFSDKTAEELREAVRALQAQGAARFVLDLRNNGGGLLDAAVEVAGQFLDGGVVLYEKRKDGSQKTYSAPASGDGLTQAPLVVLVNGSTASAAEILAGALLDRGRAPLIGQKTYGKGSVQFVFNLSDGSSLHITANLWYTPNRRELDRQGLPPTIEVVPAADGSDAEMARAIQYLLDGQ
jgi:carboxyl-terminal processing protease